VVVVVVRVCSSIGGSPARLWGVVVLDSGNSDLSVRIVEVKMGVGETLSALDAQASAALVVE
jgi:hypothetical protein